MEEAVERADAYFFPEALRVGERENIVRLRMGLLLCLTAGIGGLLFVVVQSSSWPPAGALAAFACLVTALALPFVLRRRTSIKLLGPIGCGILSVVSALALFSSAGQSIGILAFLPILPMTGLLVSGRRGALLWGCVAALIAGIGFSLAARGVPPHPDTSNRAPATVM